MRDCSFVVQGHELFPNRHRKVVFSLEADSNENLRERLGFRGVKNGLRRFSIPPGNVDFALVFPPKFGSTRGDHSWPSGER